MGQSNKKKRKLGKKTNTMKEKDFIRFAVKEEVDLDDEDFDAEPYSRHLANDGHCHQCGVHHHGLNGHCDKCGTHHHNKFDTIHHQHFAQHCNKCRRPHHGFGHLCDSCASLHHHDCDHHHDCGHHQDIQSHCNCRRCQDLCKHPVIFDRRIIVDERCFCDDKCFIDHHRCLCDERFRLRLGGLEHGMAFRFRQLIGCLVKMDVECGEAAEKVLANICSVGTDFVEVEVFKNKDKANSGGKGKIRILPFESIGSIELE
ncbi:hypothetical protein [Mesobacillus foraminis]|uniref:Uncharacterized protein n=2 Tax=Mesobacillus foraminis TaxID=279826 RepID=A0A4R2BKT9_9BACI|nr:hypothetical protein [Mesobacillus foraminis]TCN27821.1 hypothetical protein EV146_101149 [Mesobacillus foraminis]